MKITAFGLARSLGARRILQLILHLPNFLKLFVRLLKDPRVSLISKTIPLGIVAYALFPVDLFPDVLLGLASSTT